MEGWRIETDSLGEVQVPASAYYGAQTQRAVENFAISGLRPSGRFVKATGWVKLAAARVNGRLGLLEPELAGAIEQAALEVVEGRLQDQFVVDVFQAGAGTSHNMNANEVIANRANEILGQPRGQYRPVHPNDHVNMGQSTNDVIPTAMRLAALSLHQELAAALRDCEEAFRLKSIEFDPVIKAGRTHLQDAVPVTLGQEFGAYADALGHDRDRLDEAADALARLGIGGTAAGTGLNAHPDYHAGMIRELENITGLRLRSMGNLFEAMQSQADVAAYSGALRTLALTLTRIANDLRLLASGPMTGLAEIRLPAVQPGSSIMPGKINPVMAEMLNMVCYHVIGNDACVALGAQAGQLELNVMMPVMAYSLCQSVEVMTNALRSFSERCVRGIEADEERCRYWAERSLAIVTALNPYIGYRQAASVALEALRSGRRVAEVVLERGLLGQEELEAALDLEAMTRGGIQGAG
ncbi:MAG: aspartate ammonia-lyase [Anaerolineae bacterium]|nr:aspartate ammonia-lyase [Anaerolineae bacterium]